MELLELKIAYPLREPSDDTWKRLHRLASDALPEVRRQFLEAVARMRGKLDMQAVESALARNDIEGVLRLVPFHDLNDALVEVEAHLDTVRSDAFLLGRDAAVPHLHPEQLAIHLGERATLRVTFNHISPTVLESIRTTTGLRIKGITDNTRQAVREIVERAFVAGKHPRTIVKEIQAQVGLTPKQAVAIERLRTELTAAGTPPARVEKTVARAEKKKIKERATMIARTETIQAMNDGQRASWKLLVERGLLDGDAWEREWMAIVPTDGRTCPTCIALDEIRAPIDGDYEPADAKGGPPQHPDCRCTEKLVPKKRAPA
jgi:hypothetical protein